MKIINKFKISVFVIVIVIGSFFIRIWRVTEAPPSVNWDEAALGYNAYSLLKIGRDEFGKAFPVSLRSFDDYKPALYSYFTVLPTAVLGPGEFATRLTSVIFGTGLVFAVLYITAKMSGNFRLGLTAGIFTAISPWAVHFSRIAFEANLAVSIYFLAIAGFTASLKNEAPSTFWPGYLLPSLSSTGLRPRFFAKGDKNWLPVSAGLFILSMYGYHAQRAIAIPTFIGLAWVFKQRIDWKIMGLCLTLLIPLAISFLTEPAGSRLATTIILRLWPFVPMEFPKQIFSPVYSLMWQMTGQFLAYFSPATIFIRGSNEPVLRIPGLGLLPAELAPLWMAGLGGIFRKNNLNKLLRTILLLAPLPAVITWNWFSVVRTLAVYPAMAIVAAIGFRYLKLPKLLKTGYWGIIGLSTLYTVLTIGIYAPYEMYGDFQPGFEDSVPYVMENSKRYERVVVDTGQAAPYIFFLFYGKYPPAKYLREARRELKHTENYGYSFGKFEFLKLKPGQVYATDTLIAGSTWAIPDYEAENLIKLKKAEVRDFYDAGGYISLRVIEP